jgi:predicted RNA-binding protein YlqC (UPF0109 family)
MGEVPTREGAEGPEPDEDLDDDGDFADDDDAAGELADGDDGNGDDGNGGADGDGRVLDDGEDLPLIDREALTEVLVLLAKGLVDNPDAVVVRSVDREGGITLRLSVDQPDMGKVIGRSGRTARALRTLMRAAGVRAGVNTHVEIVEQEGSE